MPLNESSHNWRSRKLWFSVFAIGALFWGFKLASESAPFAAVYGTYAGAVVSVSGLFLAGNAATKWIASKGVSAQSSGKTHSTSEETPG